LTAALIATTSVDTIDPGRYVPSVVLRIAVLGLGLFAGGCLLFIVLSYTHAFWHHNRAASLGKLARAALVELGACLLLLPLWPLWWLIGASYQVTHEGDGEARGRRHPVILLHGFAMNRTNWLFLGRRLAKRGIGPLYGTSYFSPQAIRRSAVALGRFVEKVCAREQAERIDIVAHSLGGVVARYYVERLDGAKRVGRIITIGSPHRGTAVSRFGIAMPSAAQTRIGSDFYSELGPVAARAGLALTSIWSHADAVIEPPESASVAPVGEDCVFDDLGHLSLLLSPRVVDVVAERLRT
jgi:triacylglycerol esterase/lipase EstA (alpha/beta hydrolase family)